MASLQRWHGIQYFLFQNHTSRQQYTSEDLYHEFLAPKSTETKYELTAASHILCGTVRNAWDIIAVEILTPIPQICCDLPASRHAVFIFSPKLLIVALSSIQVYDTGLYNTK